MKCSAWSSLAISACSGLALLFAGTASAHVIAMPTYVASGSSQAIIFSGPNERKRPMTMFTITVPAGLEIEHAHPVEGWTEQSTASKASWSGGSLAPGADIPFRVTLKATADPGVVQVQAQQHYRDGGIVSWPVPITILPAEASPSQNLALAGVVGLIGVLLVVAVSMLAWRRRSVPPEADGEA
jgi:uncharacterized protein YcnI